MSKLPARMLAALSGAAGAQPEQALLEPGLTVAQRFQLNSSLVHLSTTGSPLHVGLPTVQELVDAGFAVEAKGGQITIPIALGPRVSTQPGTMGLDHAAQILAGELSDADSQALQNPKTQGLAGDTRAFSMRPLYAFEETYGKRRFAAAAAVAKPAAAAVAEPVTGTRSTERA